MLGGVFENRSHLPIQNGGSKIGAEYVNNGVVDYVLKANYSELSNGGLVPQTDRRLNAA
jgi:hypothetical protein